MMDYTAVFQAYSDPATLIDPSGLILDINQAFIDYAHESGVALTRADRVGKNVFDFSDADGSERLRTLIEETVQYGHGTYYQRRRQRGNEPLVLIEVNGHAIYEQAIYEPDMAARPDSNELPDSKAADPQISTVMDAETGAETSAEDGAESSHTQGKIRGILLLRRLVTEQALEETRRRVMGRLRDAIWAMTHSNDMRLVMINVRKGLRELAVPFRAFSVNMVDESYDPPHVIFYFDRGDASSQIFAEQDDPDVPILLEIWRKQAVAYRPDLQTEDRYNERSNINAISGAFSIRSVLDVPFSFGTLAINSEKPHAFDKIDVDFLREMASTLDEGFRRRLDLLRLEMAVERANELAQHAESANIAKSRFLANMSHEIRTPMNGVIGMAALLLDTGLTTAQREYVEIMRRSGEHLLAVIDDILDFSKIEADRLELDRVAFDPAEVLETVCDSLAATAQNKGLELAYVATQRVVRRFTGDPSRLRQILLNLVGNAIKFTEEGEVVVEATIENETQTGDETQIEAAVQMRFSVRDTGVGIDPSRFEVLFQPFTQADSSSSRRFGGTGLGLVISKKLVELMGGEIGVENNDQGGTTFWFTACFGRAEEPGELIDANASANLRGRRILVADDSPAARAAAAAHLTRWQCQFTLVDNAADALAHLHRAVRARAPYDAAIVEYDLRHASGAELAKLIYIDPTLKATALVVMTVITDRIERSRLFSAGYAHILAKPVKRVEFRRRLQAALHLETGSSGVPLAPPPVPAQTLQSPPALAAPPPIHHAVARVLLVEDNLVNQRVGLAMLKKLGYHADTAGNGREAVTALEAEDYDAVLMDIQMPEMDGFEATGVIRDTNSDVRNHSIPIIAMTAHALESDRTACLAAGMNDFVSKPVRPQELAAVLERWLEPRP
ncbi:MAG: response regulator [Litorilinea sp.]